MAPRAAPQPADDEIAVVKEQAWFYLDEDAEQQGPLEATDLVDLCTDGVITFDTPVWCQMLGEWQQLEQVETLCWMAQQAPPSAEAAIWHILDGEGNSHGPLTIDSLGDYLAGGSITIDCPVWSKTLGDWQRLCDVPSLRQLHGGS